MNVIVAKTARPFLYNGRAMPRNIPGTEKILPAQLVLLALGFSGPERSCYLEGEESGAMMAGRQ